MVLCVDETKADTQHLHKGMDLLLGPDKRVKVQCPHVKVSIPLTGHPTQLL